MTRLNFFSLLWVCVMLMPISAQPQDMKPENDPDLLFIHGYCNSMSQAAEVIFGVSVIEASLEMSQERNYQTGAFAGRRDSSRFGGEEISSIYMVCTALERVKLTDK